MLTGMGYSMLGNSHSIILNPKSLFNMKQDESRELRNLSMNQLNAKLSELYKELPSDKWAFQRRYRQHLLNQINQIKYEQTLRRKGLRSQGVFIIINK